MPSPAVDVERLIKDYPPVRSSGEPRRALDGVSFQVSAGEIFGVLGPNGGGKTTLFRILSTLLPSTEGLARILGVDVAGDPATVRRSIGVVFQHPALDKKLTVAENVRHRGRLHGLRGDELARRVTAGLDRLRLSDRADEPVESLSGGLQRRVEIAQSLLSAPRLLLMDEPTAGLDPGARMDVWSHLAELKRDGVTVLVTTHLMEEAERCDRLLLLDRGRVAALGTPAELRSSIAGDVIYVTTSDPDRLAAGIRERFGATPTLDGGGLRLERPSGHTFVPQLVEAFPGLVTSISVGKPTLEDVFVRRTGHVLWDEGTP
jgi:ABC-2 type transport system ATP-binding protein